MTRRILYPTLLGIAALLLATSCSNENNDVYITTFNITHYNRVLNLTDEEQPVTFSTSEAYYSVDLTNYLISLTLKAKINSIGEVAIQVTDLPLSYDSSQQCFGFSSGTFKAGAYEVTGFNGFYDFSTNNVKITAVIDGKYILHSTRVVYLPRCVTNVTKGSESFINKDAFYHFEIDPSTMDATMTIHGYRMAESQGSIEQVTFGGLKAEATPTGYHFTAATTTAESAYTSLALSDVDITVSEQGLRMNGNFVSNGYTAIATGTAFYSK